MSDTPLPELELTSEDTADLEATVQQGFAKFTETGDATWIVGMKAMGMEPAAVDAAIALGAQFVKQGLYDKAFEFFAGLQQIEAADSRVYQWLGYLYAQKKVWVAACEMFALGVNFNANDGVLRIMLGESMLMIDNDPANGIANIEKGIALAAKNPKAQIYVKRGEQLLEAAKVRKG